MNTYTKFMLMMIFLAAASTSCSAFDSLQSTPEQLVIPTATSFPITATSPPPTPTPLPTSPTYSETPTSAPSNTPIPIDTATPAEPSPTPKPEDAIRLFYINLDTPGSYGCSEAMFWLNTGVAQSPNTIADIKFAVYRLLSYRSQFIGELYNAGYASSLSVSDVKILSDGTALIELSGTYVPTDDPCDGPRFRDQIKQTVRQFAPIQLVKVTINGVNIGDVIQRK